MNRNHRIRLRTAFVLAAACVLAGCASDRTTVSAGEPAVVPSDQKLLSAEESRAYVSERIVQLQRVYDVGDDACAPVVSENCTFDQFEGPEVDLAEVANGVAAAAGQPLVEEANPESARIVAPATGVRLTPPADATADLEQRTYAATSAFVTRWIAFAEKCGTSSQECGQLWSAVDATTDAVFALGKEWKVTFDQGIDELTCEPEQGSPPCATSGG